MTLQDTLARLDELHAALKDGSSRSERAWLMECEDAYPSLRAEIERLRRVERLALAHAAHLDTINRGLTQYELDWLAALDRAVRGE